MKYFVIGGYVFLLGDLITACAIAVVAILTIVLTIAVCLLNKKAKANGKIVEQLQKAVAESSAKVENVPVVKAAPIAKKEVAAAQSTASDAAVTFAADKGKTLDDKYNMLDKTVKGYYDEIASYAAAVEGAKKFKNLRYEEYKIGSMRIVRMLIKREIIVCEFLMQNSSFRNYVAENKVSVKQAATVIKVADASAVKVVKDTIDIAVKAIADEKEAKKQLAREKRKEKRKQTA